MLTFRIITFGCKVNQYDSQQWRAALLRAGLSEAADDGGCDVALVNTCTVTAAADRQARQAVRKCKMQNTRCKIVVAGCYGQVNANALRELPQIDLVVGKYSQDSVSSVLKELGLAGKPFSEGISGFSGHTRAFLKVQDGCDHRCSYCIVPLARGQSRSRPLPEVIAEAQRLAQAGHKELVVTGVRLGDFRPSLRVLLKSLEAVDGIERIRLSSLEPDDLRLDTLEALAESRKIARHLHLPLQSGDDGVLRRMNRPYDLRTYAATVAAGLRLAPDLTFGTDIIVGFPGETEEQFNRSYQAVRDLPVTHLHVFTYSRRPGTAAAAMAGQIPGRVKQERSQRLREMFGRKQRMYWETQAGQRTAVLFESAVKGLWSGLGEHYFRVRVRSREHLGNTLRPVRLAGVSGGGMDGVLAGLPES